MMARLVLALLWLLHCLPLPLLRPLGRLFGYAFYLLGRERRQVARTNLALCFPERTPAEREAWVRRHFAYFGITFLERALFWWSRPARLERLIAIDGLERLDAALAEGPVILLAPHFVGLDAGWIRLTLARPMLSVYARQKNRVFDQALYGGRMRFNGPVLLSRQEGIRAALRHLKAGRPFYYLPDMDFGARDAVFVPFFGVPAATVTGVPRLARAAGAQVLTCITRVVPGGYQVSIGEPWADYPGGDVGADTRRMNAVIEAAVMTMPTQYFWLHKRFKTTPPGMNKRY